MARDETADEPVPLASLATHAIRSEVGPLLETVERDPLLALVELKQPRSIRCVEPGVSTEERVWLEGASVQQEQSFLLKAKESPPSPRSIETGPLVGPGGYVARTGWWRRPSNHARDKREAIQWPWSRNH